MIQSLILLWFPRTVSEVLGTTEAGLKPIGAESLREIRPGTKVVALVLTIAVCLAPFPVVANQLLLNLYRHTALTLHSTNLLSNTYIHLDINHQLLTSDYW